MKQRELLNKVEQERAATDNRRRASADDGHRATADDQRRWATQVAVVDAGRRLKPGQVGTVAAADDAGGRDQRTTPRADCPTTIKSKR